MTGWNIIDRLKEPSTWASIAAGLGTFGVAIPGPTWQAISLVGAGLAMLAGIVLKEGSH